MGYKRAQPHASNYFVEKYKHVYLPLAGWGGTYAIANASDQGDIAIADAVVSAGAGNPSFDEVTDSGVVGLFFLNTLSTFLSPPGASPIYCPQ